MNRRISLFASTSDRNSRQADGGLVVAVDRACRCAALLSLFTTIVVGLVPAVGRAADQPQPTQQPIRVVTGIPPIAYLVEQIGGKRVQIEVLSASGVCSHQLALSPKQAQALAKSDVIFSVGLPFEQQLAARLQQTGSTSRFVCLAARSFAIDSSGTKEDLSRKAPVESSCPDGRPHHHHDGHACPSATCNSEPPSSPRAARVVSGHGPACEHDHACDHDHGGEAADDPHVWLDPASLRSMAQRIAEALAELDPQAAPEFRKNQQVWENRVRSLKQHLDDRLADLSGQSIYVYHPSLGYLCRAYGLRQIAIESDGKPPSAKQLRELIGRAKAERVRAVFVEPNGDRRSAALIAEAIGAGVVEFDPLAADPIKNLADAADQIARARTFARP